MIATMEFGFMSTSTAKSRSLEFCGNHEVTLLCIHPRLEDAFAGALLSWCSDCKDFCKILYIFINLCDIY